jgi:hypothetical protein
MDDRHFGYKPKFLKKNTVPVQCLPPHQIQSSFQPKNLVNFWNFCFSSVNSANFANFVKKIHQFFNIEKLGKRKTPARDPTSQKIWSKILPNCHTNPNFF